MSGGETMNQWPYLSPPRCRPGIDDQAVVQPMNAVQVQALVKVDNRHPGHLSSKHALVWGWPGGGHAQDGDQGGALGRHTAQIRLPVQAVQIAAQGEQSSIIPLSIVLRVHCRAYLATIF